MASTISHTIYAALPVTVARMPSLVRTGAGVVTLDRQAGALTWQWRASNARGFVRLSALDRQTARLAVTADGPASVPTADALTVVLYGVLERQWAPPAATPSAGLGRRSKIGLAVAAILVPVLAVTGMRVLAPPVPMDVATAVAQFREQSREPSVQLAGERDESEAPRARRPAERGVDAGVEPGRRAPQRARRTESLTDQRRRSAHQTRQTDAGDPAPRPRAREQGRPRTSVPAPRQQVASAEPERRPAQPQAPSKKQAIVTSPPEGVYRYATSGYESIDRPSSRHDYPSETAMSIRATDCGFTARWQPLENRWDEMSVCRAGGEALLPRLTTHREFYGQQNDSNYECGRTNYAYRPEPGATWVGSCSDGDAKMEIRGRTIGTEPVRVGDETVDAVHYTLEARIFGGDADGTWNAQRWVDPDTGLLLRVEARTNATSQSSVGTVQYQEELSLRLLSMTPER